MIVKAVIVRYFALPAVLLALGIGVASQTYVAPPPPNLPAVLSQKMIDQGKLLFEKNVLVSGRMDIYNFLGAEPCSACHDSPTPLKPESLAADFAELKGKINNEIVVRNRGSALPLQDPAMEALVQYLIFRYQLYDYKLSK